MSLFSLKKKKTCTPVKAKGNPLKHSLICGENCWRLWQCAILVALRSHGCLRDLLKESSFRSENSSELGGTKKVAKMQLTGHLTVEPQAHPHHEKARTANSKPKNARKVGRDKVQAVSTQSSRQVCLSQCPKS